MTSVEVKAFLRKIAAKGGRSKSRAKREASRKNVLKAHAARRKANKKKEGK